MRLSCFILLILCATAGCRPSQPPAASDQVPAAGPPDGIEKRAAEGPAAEQPAAPDSSTVAAPAEPVPFDPATDDDLTSLWTRTAGEDWPGFLGPNRDSHSPETGILTDWSGGRLRLVWQRELGEGYDIGSISRGRLFQFDRFGDKARLTCFHAETGRQLWRFEYPTHYKDMYGYNGGPRASPVVDGNRVYIFGAEGMLHCVRADNGRLIWRVDTAKQFGVVQNFFGVGSTPVVEGDLLIVMVGGCTEASQDVPPGRLDLVEGNGSGIVAFDKFTGQVRYRITDELASYSSPKLATIDGRRWCFVFARGGLVGFEPATGKVDFHYPWRARILESVNASTPVVVGNEVFISETYGPGSSLLRVRPGGYDVVWRDDPKSRTKAMQTHWNTPVYDNGYLYGCSGRHSYNAELRCIQWKTGKVMWSKSGLARTSLLWVDGHLVCLGEYGLLQLIKVNPKRYEPVTQLYLGVAGGDEGRGQLPRLESPCWAAPILSHGLLYLRGNNRLICLELIPQGG